ncbi:MAG TPA: S-adenosylmethionine:tRNA ribosyltransferase-isomerase [Chloroflexota bacterium]|nr:S-adenosylmethionine:tRNA ribosyltransferase-isomerase [Chloroflexota bacterium]
MALTVFTKKPELGLLPSFHLPPGLEAREPPEARGLGRDGVRLLVSHYTSDRLAHTIFRGLPEHLTPGDLLVINTSATVKGSLPARRADGTQLRLHLSTQLPNGQWLVEPRQPAGPASLPFSGSRAGETLALPGGATATLLRPHRPESGAPRLWEATLSLPRSAYDYLRRHGSPIRYDYVSRPWPISYYQTVYATEPGSAEMVSAGRAFTSKLIAALVGMGITLAPLILHTGVASQERDEPPYEEYYRVSETTARLINSAREAGSRVIAVGTTVIRALETVTDHQGVTRAGSGWTDLVIKPTRRLRAVDGLLTGFHEPRSTHLAMLTALASVPHLALTYVEALRERYLWHEFGDLHLIVP